MSKETKSKVANAFLAMKAIGISEAKVKPVLKNLLKLYDKNWELIEEENYRALADAIFETEESEAQEQSKKIVNTEAAEQSKKRLNTQAEDHSDEEAQATEEPERPLKRLRLRHRGGQTSSINTSNAGMVQTLLVQPKEEPVETIVPQTNGSMSTRKSPQPTGESATIQSQAVIYQSAGRDKGKQPVSAEPLAINERCDPPKPSSMSKGKGKAQIETEPRSHSRPMRLRGRRAGVISPQSTSKEKRHDPDSSAHPLCLKEPKPEPDVLPSPDKKNTSNHALITPKDEPVTDDMPCLEVPVVNCTDTSKGENSLNRHELLIENCEPLALQPLSEKETADGDMTLNQSSNVEPLMIAGECSSNMEITSSPSGEVRIYLKSDLACGRSDFKMPSLEAILKCVEDKYLRSKQTLGPDISLINIMKEICQCFLEFGTNSDSQSQNTVDIIPPPDPTSKYPAPDDGLVAHDFCMISSNRLDDPRSTDKVPECCTSVTCYNNVNDGEQPTMNVGEDIVIDGENQKSSVPETNVLCLETVQQPPVTPCNGIDDAVRPSKMGTPDDISVDTVNPENGTHETNCLSWVTPQILTPLQTAVDIAKGLEKVVITLVNELNDESPPSFYYIPQNAAFQNAYVNFCLARIGDKNCCPSCSGDCLSSPTVCACARETGGEFAYTSDGLVKEELLKECISMNRDPKKHCQYFCKECPLERSKCGDIIEPCKGHLVRKFIKECWWKCGCNKQCGNRVVQRGITRNLQVFMTPGGKGWGLRTVEDLPKGAFVCEYVGEVLTNAELFERVLKSPEGEKHSYPVLLDADWCAEAVLKDEDALCLDATYYGNVARFINHRCYDSNLVEIPVEVETPDHHYYHLAFFTTRKVKAMEELTWDYGIDFDDHEHPIKAFRCHCGSKFCRNIKRSRSRSSRR